MHTAFDSYTGEEALEEFLAHVRATRAPKTLKFYGTQLRQLKNWAEDNGVPFPEFTKRSMDKYLAFRRATVSATTLRHDGVATKVFLK